MTILASDQATAWIREVTKLVTDTCSRVITGKYSGTAPFRTASQATLSYARFKVPLVSFAARYPSAKTRHNFHVVQEAQSGPDEEPLSK